MKRRVALLAGVLACIGLAAPAAASPVPARGPLGGTLVDLCYDSVGKPLNSPQYAACRGFQAAVDSVASLCRLPARDLSNPALVDDCGLVDGRRINSCMALAVSLDGALVTTIEGLAPDGALHPVQAAFIAHDAFQCGFCTPGQIMSAVGLIAEGQVGSDPDRVREGMSGNICRCSAYQGITEAVLEAQKVLAERERRNAA